MRLAGAGHMLAAHPDDPSTARGFLETPTEADQDRLRDALADLVTTFLSAHLCGDTAAKARLEHCAEHPEPEIADIRRR